MKTRLCRRDDLLVLCLEHAFNLAHTAKQAIRHARAHDVTSDVAVDAPLDRLVVSSADKDRWLASLAAVGLRVVHTDAPTDSAYGNVDIVSCPCEEGRVYWIDRVAQTPETVERTPKTVLRAMVEAYEAAWFERVHVLLGENKNTWFDKHLDWLERAVRQLRWEYISALRGDDLFITGTELLPDYEARLRDKRPLDAPPLEVA